VDCCASAPENDATAIKLATAETFVAEYPVPSAEPTTASKRSDLGALTLLISSTPPKSTFVAKSRCDELSLSVIEREFFYQCDQRHSLLESPQFKGILICGLKSF
jgi:hypothetical protein